VHLDLRKNYSVLFMAHFSLLKILKKFIQSPKLSFSLFCINDNIIGFISSIFATVEAQMNGTASHLYYRLSSTHPSVLWFETSHFQTIDISNCQLTCLTNMQTLH
jgi:hypothetical protein